MHRGRGDEIEELRADSTEQSTSQSLVVVATPKCMQAMPLVIAQVMPRDCAAATRPVKNVSSSA
jgi:hypothetical protein